MNGSCRGRGHDRRRPRPGPRPPKPTTSKSFVQVHVAVAVHVHDYDNVDVTGGKPQTPRTIPPGGDVTVVRTGEVFPAGSDSPFARKIREWTTLDLILNYTFNFPAPAPAEVPGFAKDGGKNVKMKDGKEKNVVPVSTAEYGCSNWKWWLNNTTVTLGMQNVFDENPPFVLGNFENAYDESLTTIKGRFWYVGLKKRF